MIFKVGQIVKNKRTKLVRRIAKVSKGMINWISKDSKRKGVCTAETMSKWVNGLN